MPAPVFKSRLSKATHAKIEPHFPAFLHLLKPIPLITNLAQQPTYHSKNKRQRKREKTYTPPNFQTHQKKSQQSDEPAASLKKKKTISPSYNTTQQSTYQKPAKSATLPAPYSLHPYQKRIYQCNSAPLINNLITDLCRYQALHSLISSITLL